MLALNPGTWRIHRVAHTFIGQATAHPPRAAITHSPRASAGLRRRERVPRSGTRVGHGRDATCSQSVRRGSPAPLLRLSRTRARRRCWCVLHGRCGARAACPSFSRDARGARCCARAARACMADPLFVGRMLHARCRAFVEAQLGVQHGCCPLATRRKHLTPSLTPHVAGLAQTGSSLRARLPASSSRAAAQCARRTPRARCGCQGLGRALAKAQAERVGALATARAGRDLVLDQVMPRSTAVAGRQLSLSAHCSLAGRLPDPSLPLRPTSKP